MVRLERSFIPWLSHFHIWKNYILSYVKYFKKAKKWYSAKHDPNYLYTVLHCWFIMPFASPFHSFAVWLFHCLKLLAIKVGGKCRIGATPSYIYIYFLYMLCFPPPHLCLYYPLALLPLRQSGSCLLYSLFFPSSPDFFLPGYIQMHFPTSLVTVWQNSGPMSCRQSYFLGLTDRQSHKKREPILIFYFPNWDMKVMAGALAAILKMKVTY